MVTVHSLRILHAAQERGGWTVKERENYTELKENKIQPGRWVSRWMGIGWVMSRGCSRKRVFQVSKKVGTESAGRTGIVVR